MRMILRDSNAGSWVCAPITANSGRLGITAVVFGYAHEALARAYVLFGDSREARLHLKLAAGSEICVDRSPGWSASLLRNGD